MNNKDYVLYLYGKNDRIYNSREDFVINLGVNKEQDFEVKISFEKIGTYSLDNVFAHSYNPKIIVDNINILKKDTLDNVIIKNNYVEGNIFLDEDKYIMLTIPYSEGWKAYVNGSKTEVLKANQAYSALYLKSGNNNIVLKYNTPYLKMGALVSLISFVLLVADYIIIYKTKHNN